MSKNAKPELTGKWTKKGVDALIDIFAENPEELAKGFLEQHNKVVAKLEASLKTRHNEITRVRNQLKRLEAENEKLTTCLEKQNHIAEDWCRLHSKERSERIRLKQELADVKIKEQEFLNWFIKWQRRCKTTMKCYTCKEKEDCLISGAIIKFNKLLGSGKEVKP